MEIYPKVCINISKITYILENHYLGFHWQKSKRRSFLVQNLERNEIRRKFEISQWIVWRCNYLKCCLSHYFLKVQIMDLIFILPLLHGYPWVSSRRLNQKFSSKLSQANTFNHSQPQILMIWAIIVVAQVKSNLSPWPFQHVYIVYSDWIFVCTISCLITTPD